jgi:hypothetical protein
MTPTPPPATSRDRRQILLAPGARYNGIDYVEVTPSQLQLYVHFINHVGVEGSLDGQTPVTISGGEVIATVPVGPIHTTDWSFDSEGRPVLALGVPSPGDFSTYTLSIEAPSTLDPYFSSVPFSFKANCPSTLDCATPTPSCPPEMPIQVPIDYLAKDFGSFTQALSEFSAVRYPAWVERSEADLGIMLMEALAAMADELSYYQDRVAAESTIETATQRLSVVRHARLVDYEPAPATVAQTTLQLQVSAAGSVTSPLGCRAVLADGTFVNFEIGGALADPATGELAAIDYPVDPRWNRGALATYYWDDSQRCLLAGSTELFLQGHGLGLTGGQQLLLDSPAADSADPPLREIVTVLTATETSDPVLGYELTAVTLGAPTTLDHDLYPSPPPPVSAPGTWVAGNLVPATQGVRSTETFTIPDPTQPPPGPVVVRIGPNWTPQDPIPDYRYCLAAGPVAWYPSGVPDEDTPVPAVPEMVLLQDNADGTTTPWQFQRWLLDSGASDEVFTVTPEQYSPVLVEGGDTFYDYDGDGGTTIRFGDGTFGISPATGTVFNAVYRSGIGSDGNVPADTITDLAAGPATVVTACTNPFAATGGAGEETIAQVRVRAPQQFSAEPLRAVRPEDYVAAAQTLDWVQQAGTTFRWTGSWLTVFTSADPAGAERPTIGELEALTELLDRERLAGYESYVLPPDYVSVDLQIVVCGKPTYFGSDVERAILDRLSPGPLPGGGHGFFDHSQWGFCQALEPSALLAAIQSCTGVDGVYSVLYRQRGVQATWTELTDPVTVGSNQILRVDNDPSRPEAGSLQVTVEGAK